jgi:hypothetical protein
MKWISVSFLPGKEKAVTSQLKLQECLSVFITHTGN